MDDDDDGNEDDDQEGHVAPPGGDRWSCAPDPCQIKTQVMPHTDSHKCYTRQCLVDTGTLLGRF